jgi:multicomponent K+:H+ antiporter subunit D
MPAVGGAVLVSALFFVSAIAMTGLPPLSGFLGKLMVLEASFPTDAMTWVFAVVLISSLVNVVGFSRAGSILFWKAKSLERPDGEALPAPPTILSSVAVGGLLTLLIAHTVFAGPIHSYMTTTSQQLYAPAPYISTVLDTPGKLTREKSANEKGYGADEGSTSGEGH